MIVIPTVAHNVFGVAQTINSANFIYFEALQRTLQLGHPNAVHIYTSQLKILTYPLTVVKMASLVASSVYVYLAVW